MPAGTQRQRSATGVTLSRRESSIPYDAHLVDAGRNLVGINQSFVPAQPRTGSFSVCGVLFVTYLVCASFLGAIGLVTVLHHHQSFGDRIMQRRLREPVTLPRSTIETLADMLRFGRAPNDLLEYSDVKLCPNAGETKELERLPPKVKFLLIIGSQKAGTTWLYDALTKHQSFIASMRRPGPEGLMNGRYANRATKCHLGQSLLEDADIWATLDPWSAKLLTKEPQYFNRWPLPPIESYLHAWHSGVVGAMVSGAAGQRVLLDASPQYMMSAVAPPRVKAAIPHARFVLVVRDPPMRAMSDFIMMRRQHPGCESNPSRMCPNANSTFLEVVQSELLNHKRPLQCFFNSTVRSLLASSAGPESDHTTWHDCFSCAFNFIELESASVQEVCKKQQKFLQHRNCSKPHYGFLDHGMYAAQLAWWLRFFPPEQFLIISAGQLRDPEQRIRILNEVKDHAGLLEAQPFTAELVNGTEGFGGRYNVSDFTDDDHHALKLLREFYIPEQRNLHKLVSMLYPGSNFLVHPES